MIHVIVFPLLVAAFVLKKGDFKIGVFIVAIASSVLAIVVGAEIWPLHMIAVGCHWAFAAIIGLGIRWFLNRRQNKQ